MRRLAATFGVLLITVLLTGPVLAGPVDNPKIKAFLLAGRLQAELLNNIGQTFSDMTLKQARSQLTIFDDIKKFKDMAAQLKDIIGYDQPGREKITKYYKKLINSKRTVDIKSIALLQAHNEDGRIDLETARALAEEADRVMYRVQELIRHLHADIDLTGTSRPVRMQLAEALLLVQMQGGLLQAVKEAFEETIGGMTGGSDNFWYDLGLFDVNAAVYRTIVDLDDPANKAKRQLYDSLKRLKHEVVMTGEKMFVASKKSGKTELADCRKLLDIKIKTLNAFELLLDVTFK